MSSVKYGRSLLLVASCFATSPWIVRSIRSRIGCLPSSHVPLRGVCLFVLFWVVGVLVCFGVFVGFSLWNWHYLVVILAPLLNPQRGI